MFLSKPLKRFFLLFRFPSPWFNPLAMKFNGIGGMGLSVGYFLSKPLKRFYLLFRFPSPWFKPRARKCNGIGGMGLSVGFFYRTR